MPQSLPPYEEWVTLSEEQFARAINDIVTRRRAYQQQARVAATPITDALARVLSDYFDSMEHERPESNPGPIRE